MLFYGTGGLAYGHTNSSATLAFPAVTYHGSRGTWQAGWAAGVGAEYAITNAWSAKLEWLHYDLGRATVSAYPSPFNPPFMTQTHVNFVGHIVRAGINYRFDSIPFLGRSAAEPGPISFLLASDFTVASGLRYWYSSGKTQKDLWALPTTFPGLISRLTWSGLDAHSGESFMRIDHKSGLFAKGFTGMGAIGKGRLNDQDFFSSFGSAFSDSSTLSNQHNGSLAYFSADLGYTFWQTPDYRLGAFAGYHYYRETVNAHGCQQMLAAIPPVCMPAALPDAEVVITDDTRWHSIRVGLNGSAKITDRLTLTVDAAYLP